MSVLRDKGRFDREQLTALLGSDGACVCNHTCMLVAVGTRSISAVSSALLQWLCFESSTENVSKLSLARRPVVPNSERSRLFVLQ